MKKTLLFSMILLSTICSVTAASKKNASVIADVPTVQAFKQDAVPEKDLKSIAEAGINSQSAMNMQPWHFTVVTNKDVLKGISDKMKSGRPAGAPDGKAPAGKAPAGAPAGASAGNFAAKAGMGDSPAAIIVSCKDGSEFDAGLATEIMALEAFELGYGSKIISSPTMVLNDQDKAEYKKLLGIPEDMSVKAIILIGKYDQSESDAISGATTRKKADEVLTFVK